MVRIHLIHVSVFPNTFEDGIKEYRDAILKRDALIAIDHESWEDCSAECTDAEDIHYDCYLGIENAKKFAQMVLDKGWGDSVSFGCRNKDEDKVFEEYADKLDIYFSYE